ncbi:MAG: ribonuclease HI [Hyphomonadaceae bacterium]|nr:ribonuclease HI [Clostridia bacterium]
MKKVIIYTDGACSGNPGAGGYGAILMHGELEREVTGYAPHTTNNRMELCAAIAALDVLKQPCEVDLYSDSAYLVNAINKNWILNWQKNGWKTSNKQPVENQDLWQQIITHTRTHTVHFHKVKGHSDNPYNNRCDALARGAIDSKRGS